MSNETPLAKYLAILPHTPEEKVLKLLVQLGVTIADADEGSLVVLDEPAKELVFAMTVGGGENSDSVLRGQRVPLGKGLIGLAALTREIQIGSPTFKDVRQPEAIGSEGPACVLAAPMLVGEKLAGVITAISTRPGFRFGSREADLYAGFASIAGVIVEQRQRLNLLETVSASPPGEAGNIERRMLNSLSHILRRQPDSLNDVANLLAAIEKLLGSRF